jgi:hypothetical protein
MGTSKMRTWKLFIEVLDINKKSIILHVYGPRPEIAKGFELSGTSKFLTMLEIDMQSDVRTGLTS